MKEKELFYFVYHKRGWFNSKEKIFLDSAKQLENIINSLEGGNNLFALIPKLKRSDFRGQSLSYAYFQMSYAHFSDEYSLPAESFHSVGKLLIPYYNTIKRDKLIEKSKGSSIFNLERTQCVKVFDKNYYDEIFFKVNDKYFCLERDDVMVLNKNQL